MNIDYEYMILEMADIDSDIDDCANCPYKGDNCRSQCEEIIEARNILEVYNELCKFS